MVVDMFYLVGFYIFIQSFISLFDAFVHKLDVFLQTEDRSVPFSQI